MKWIYFGTPESAETVLKILTDHGFKPDAVFTNPDRPVGRKQILTASPVKNLAAELGLPVYQPEKMKDAEEFLRSQDWDFFIVVAYGKIFPQWLLDLPKQGCFNVHYSLLPRWRGASCNEAVILAGDEKTGFTIQKMEFELDKGPIVIQKEYLLTHTETAEDLKAWMSTEAGNELVALLPKLETGDFTTTLQNDIDATYCGKIEKKDGELLATDTDEQKWRKYLAYFGWPGVFYFSDSGKRVKITKAKYENNAFVIERVIPEGGKEQDY